MGTGYIIREQNPYGIYLTRESAKRGLDTIFNIYRSIHVDKYKTRELEWIDDECFCYTVKNDIGQIEIERMFKIEPVDIIQSEEDFKNINV